MSRNLVLSALAGAVAFVSSALWADDYYWIGPDGGDYYAAANWSKGAPTGGEAAVPGKLDKAIFDPGAGETLTVTNSHANSKLYIYIKDISILSGTVTMLCARAATDASGDYASVFYAADNVTNTLHVADGAVFNSWYRYHATTAGKGIVMKTGGGTAIFSNNGWYNTSGSYRVEEFIVAGGTFRHAHRAGQVAHHWRVLSGGILNSRQYSHLQHYNTYSIDKGGKVMLEELSAQYQFAGLEGEGELNIYSASGYPGVRLNLNGGPYRFKGTFTTSTAPWFRNYYPNASYPADADARHFPVAASKMYDVFTAYYAGTAPEFDPGIGEFYLPPLMSEPGIPFVTEDTDGEPIVLHANIYSGDGLSGSGFPNYNAVVISGPGDWWMRSGTQSVTGNQVRVTGQVGVPSGATLQFGNGTDAAADFTSYPFAITNLGTVTFANVGAQTLARAFANAGTLTAKSPLTLAAYRSAAKEPVIKADGTTLTLTGSSVYRSGALPTFANGGTIVLDGPRVEMSANKSTSANANNPWHTNLKAPGGMTMTGQTDASLLRITDGATFHFGGTGCQMPNTEVTDGGKLVIRDAGCWNGPSSGTRAITLDGGFLNFAPSYSVYAASCFNNYAANMRLYLGEKGGTIGSANSSKRVRFGSSLEVDFNCAIAPKPGLEGTDGGLTIDSGTVFMPVNGWSIAGPVTLGDVRFHVSKAWYDAAATAGEPFGPGDFIMDHGGWLSFGDKDAAMDLRVASGAGSRLRLKAHGRISLDCYTAQTKRTGVINLVFGAADSAAESVLDCGEFGALTFHASNNKDYEMPTNFTVRVEGGVPLHADGRTKAPLFFQDGYATDFLTCDANNFLTNFNGYVSGFGGGAESTAFVGTNDKYTLPAGTTQVGAIKFYLNGEKKNNVTIPEDATLKVGNGTDPAIILFQLNTSAQVYMPFGGAGAVDFGTSKGWFVYPHAYNGFYTYPVRLTSRISGSGGMVFSSATETVITDSGENERGTFSLETANDWTGGTMIDMSAVRVMHKDALSTGKVTVKGSRLSGGSVVFSCAGPFANDFDISRFGREICYYLGGYWPSSTGWNSISHGAFEFESVGTRLTGTVTVTDHSRLTSFYPADGSEVAIFEGEVKGAHLEILSVRPALKRHKFVFCCDNHSLTGGVDILNGATAVLRGANPSLGTGTIAMADEGTLRFENTAEYTFTNKVEGAGIFQLGSEKEVFLAGDFSELDSGLVDLAGLRHEFSQIPPFPVTNTTGRATLAFKGGLGTVDAGALELQGAASGYDLAIGGGTFLDLGGGTLTVRRLTAGDKSQVVNGTFVELKPREGTVIVIR